MFIKNRVTYDSFVVELVCLLKTELHMTVFNGTGMFIKNRVTYDSFVVELVCLLKTELHMTVL